MKLTSSGYVVSKGRVLLLFVFFIGSILGDQSTADGPAKSSSVEPASSSNGSSIGPSELTKNVRLPRVVLPHRYDVRLFPILEEGNFSFLGHVSIELECKEETDRIILHSKDIVVDPKSVEVMDGKINKTLMVDGIEYDTELEFLTVRLCPVHEVNLTKGTNYTLTMSFMGNLTDETRGLYRTTYKEDGVENYMAMSKMEPTDARRAFPCFDEPNMKAVFAVTLGRHRDMIALSNMPLINTTAMEGMDGFYWDQFAPSVPMSTYLVAFVVANFTQVQADVGNATWKFNIYARPSASNQTQYASNIGPRIQLFFEDYFQIPFPLPKQDMIAIPDFDSGAMENWGLITYHEILLLYDEEASAWWLKEQVVKTISHELAHQWFGNLVTMDWWTDLWLNEGFANYVAYLGAEHVEPNYKFLQHFVTIELQYAMRSDALESSHPISIVVHHPDEIKEIFDSISYGKGATIIRMLAAFIGENTFRQGLTNYLTSHQYGNAVQDDLWMAIDNQAKVSKVSLPTGVKEIMDTWTLKMGFPVIMVKRDYASRTISLSQERFLKQRSNGTSTDKTVYLWWVPLTYTADYKTIGSTWLANNQTSKNIELDIPVDRNQWIIFNVEQAGYYRVNYDQQNWGLIAQQLMTNHSAISVNNRAQIMDDALNLAEAGQLDYETALNLTCYLEHETDYVPWTSAFYRLTYISKMMSRTSGYGILKKHFRKIITPLYNLVGFDKKANEEPMMTKFREFVVDWACSFGNKDCVSQAINLYAQWMADPENAKIISPDLKSTVICTAIREGGEAEWEFSFNRYLFNDDAVLLYSLYCSESSSTLAKILGMTLNSTSGIPENKVSLVIRQVARNPLGRYMAFNFIRDNWDQLRVVLPTFSELSFTVNSVAVSFNTELEIKELLEFRNEHKEFLDSAARSTQQMIDNAKDNFNWMNHNYQKVVDWLRRFY